MELEVELLGHCSRSGGLANPVTSLYFLVPEKPSRTFLPPWISAPIPLLLPRRSSSAASDASYPAKTIAPRPPLLSAPASLPHAARRVPRRCHREGSLRRTALFHDEVDRAVEAFVIHASSAAWRSMLMCLGFAAFLAFTQQSVTGPIRKFLPFPLRFPRSEGRNDGGGEWDARARNQLISMALMCMELLIHVNRSST
ncbi:uncharacterized protein LOC141811566 [Curcuma longa]|uniref:uncharacterized protein LOC141811566 n=1 Tax=Curcuma longa TaxID=136217 RepID=UPI003D9E68CB